jgi:hypothetical protein
MDENFKEDLKRFFKIYWEYKMGSADDFIFDFEEFIKEKGYDLSTVIQYKKK